MFNNDAQLLRHGSAEKLQSDWSLQDLGTCTTRCMRSYQTLFLACGDWRVWLARLVILYQPVWRTHFVCTLSFALEIFSTLSACAGGLHHSVCLTKLITTYLVCESKIWCYKVPYGIPDACSLKMHCLPVLAFKFFQLSIAYKYNDMLCGACYTVCI